MFRRLVLAMFYFSALPCAVAEPSVLYQPATGEFWISGTQQPDGRAALFLYSDSGQIVYLASSPWLAAYPISPEGWLGKEVSISLPRDYIDPLYIGLFANPGTPIGDLSAEFVFASFYPRVYIDQFVPIRLVPEPATTCLIAWGVGIGLCILRSRKS